MLPYGNGDHLHSPFSYYRQEKLIAFAIIFLIIKSTAEW